MRYLLIDTEEDWKSLLPLTYFREISNIRLGILKISEKWELLLNSTVGVQGVFYLKKKQDFQPVEVIIRSSVLPDEKISKQILHLEPGQCLFSQNGDWIACRKNLKTDISLFWENVQNRKVEKIFLQEEIKLLKRPWELIFLNEKAIVDDFGLLKLNHTHPGSLHIEGEYPVFVHPSAQLSQCVIDATQGPVFIDEKVKILPFTFIKGPAAVMQHSLVKAGTRIYNGSTLGPWTKAGGEIKNVLFFGYSNKGHDGFLGDSVVGEWCNFGAGTSNSNLKNNYSGIRFWNIARGQYEDTGKMFLGLVMGDFSKTAINTSINTGTLIGVNSNIFTRRFPPKFVNSFNWGGEKHSFNYELSKAMDTAQTMFLRRQKEFTPAWKRLFEQVRILAGQMEKF